MAKLIESYVAKLIDVVPVIEDMKEMDENWSWRRECIGMEGDLLILESEYRHPGERFVDFFNDDDMWLATSYGTFEFREDRMILTTKHSIYTFQILA